MDSESINLANSHLKRRISAIRTKRHHGARGRGDGNERLEVNVAEPDSGSLRTEQSGSHSLGLSAGYSESEDSDGRQPPGYFGANFRYRTQKKWVSEQTAYGQCKYLRRNKTTLKGVIASTSNALTLNTGSFEYII